MARQVGATETEDRRDDETDDADADGRDKRLGQDVYSERTMISDPPSPFDGTQGDPEHVEGSAFVCDWLPHVFARVPTPSRALDLAMGRGRHTLLLARTGFQTFGVDVKRDAVRDAAREAARQGLTIHAWCADLRVYPLPRRRFDLIVVTRYLQRDLMASIRDAVAPGGFIVYETFTVNQRAHGTGPRSPDHLLETGELTQSFKGFDVVFAEEISEPEAVARLVAVRPGSRRP